jgi:hypothetical protein
MNGCEKAFTGRIVAGHEGLGQPARLGSATTLDVFELRYVNGGTVVHRYSRESSALAFVRDVVRHGSRDEAARFSLIEVDDSGAERTLAAGAELVTRAYEDRAD